MANPEPKTLNKLDYNTSFRDWRTELESVLVENQLNYVLAEPKPPEPTATTPQYDIALHQRWLLHDLAARVVILQALHESVYASYHRHETAKSLMEALTNDFKPSMSSSLVKFRRYMDHKMAEHTLVTDHIAEMGSLASELESNGVKVSEEQQVLLLMNSLPDSWKIGEQLACKERTRAAANEGRGNIDLDVDSDEMSLDNLSKWLVKKEQEKFKLNPHMYTIIKVSCDNDILEQIGKDIYFDLVDHDKVRSFCVPNQMPFDMFKGKVAKEFGIPVEFLRFWHFTKRMNNTWRPHLPRTEIESVGKLRDGDSDLKLFLEVEPTGLDLRPRALPIKKKDDILLFFKLYDPETEELRYVGRLFVKLTGTPGGILSNLNELAGYALDQEIDFYEEIKFNPIVMCIPIVENSTFQFSEFEDGDIICFQKRIPVEHGLHFRYPNVQLFLESRQRLYGDLLLNLFL